MVEEEEAKLLSEKESFEPILLSQKAPFESKLPKEKALFEPKMLSKKAIETKLLNTKLLSCNNASFKAALHEASFKLRSQKASFEAKLLSQKASFNYRERGDYIQCMAASATGVVAYSKRVVKGPHDNGLHSLHVDLRPWPSISESFPKAPALKEDEIKTLIHEASRTITGLTFLCVSGKEQLLVHHGIDVSLYDLESGVERKLCKLEKPTYFANEPGDDKALYFVSRESDFEIWELQVTPDTHHKSLKARVDLVLSWIFDICQLGSLLVVSGKHPDEGCLVACVSIRSQKVRWVIKYAAEKQAVKIFPGLVHGTIFVLNQRRYIYQISLKNGSDLGKIKIIPDRDFPCPLCFCTREDELYVSEQDTFFNQGEMIICQYKLIPNWPM